MTHSPRSRPGADLARILPRLLPLALLMAMEAPDAGAERFARTVWVEKFGYAA